MLLTPVFQYCKCFWSFYFVMSFKIVSVSQNTPFEPVNPLLKAFFIIFNGVTHQTLINRWSQGISRIVSLSRQMVFEFRKEKIVTRSQVWRIRWVWKDGDLLWLQNVGHNACLVSGCIIMQKTDVLKSCLSVSDGYSHWRVWKMLSKVEWPAQKVCFGGRRLFWRTSQNKMIKNTCSIGIQV